MGSVVILEPERRVTAFFRAVIFGTALATSLAAADRSDETTVLAQPLSPGAIAGLVEFPTSSRAEARLVEALASSRSEIRAAAARVIFATAHASLTPQLLRALESEAAEDAIVEESRAIAWLGGPPGRHAVLDAWRRHPTRLALLSLAASSSPPEALELIATLRAGNVNAERLADVIRLASKGDSATLTVMIGAAIDANDSDLLASSLTAVRDAHVSLPSDVVLRGLSEGLAPRLPLTMIWHLLRERSSTDPQPVPADVGRRVTAIVGDGTRPDTDPQTVLGFELARRMMGRSARKDDAWRAFLRERSPGLSRFFSIPAVQTLLTQSERSTLAKTYGEGTGSESIAYEFRPHPAPPPAVPLVSASGYPVGLM
jgi:hypothetical protein